MGFFDDFSKKVNKFSKDAVTKTKNISEIARLNREISIAKNKINNGYKEIGSKVYDGFLAGDKDERFTEAFEGIKSSFDLIKTSEEKILELKEITICPKCGAELDMECAFCGKCGAKIVRPEKPKEEEPKTSGATLCKKCGAEIPDDSEFCPSCGAKK